MLLLTMSKRSLPPCSTACLLQVYGMCTTNSNAALSSLSGPQLLVYTQQRFLPALEQQREVTLGLLTRYSS